MTTQKPPVYLLILLHGVLLLAYAMYGVQNGLQAFLSLINFVVLLVIASIFHLIFWLITRKRSVSNFIRVPVYLLPVFAFLLLGSILPNDPQLENQTSPLASPSKRYTMKMEIKENRWIISIFDKSGTQLYRDDKSQFLGHLNVYWIWDKDDRLWLYNSDSAFVYYWSETPEGWRKICWGWEHDQRSAGRFKPPEALYPEYAKKKR